MTCPLQQALRMKQLHIPSSVHDHFQAFQCTKNHTRVVIDSTWPSILDSGYGHKNDGWETPWHLQSNRLFTEIICLKYYTTDKNYSRKKWRKKKFFKTYEKCYENKKKRNESVLVICPFNQMSYDDFHSRNSASDWSIKTRFQQSIERSKNEWSDSCVTLIQIVKITSSATLVKMLNHQNVKSLS